MSVWLRARACTLEIVSASSSETPRAVDLARVVRLLPICAVMLFCSTASTTAMMSTVAGINRAATAAESLTANGQSAAFKGRPGRRLFIVHLGRRSSALRSQPYLTFACAQRPSQFHQRGGEDAFYTGQTANLAADGVDGLLARGQAACFGEGGLGLLDEAGVFERQRSLLGHGFDQRQFVGTPDMIGGVCF